MSFFHCCLLEPRLCAEELSQRVAVLKIGNWTKTLKLPGHRKWLRSLHWEPVDPGPPPVMVNVDWAAEAELWKDGYGYEDPDRQP